jgi:DNA-binding CsgD family transcriptional regulator
MFEARKRGGNGNLSALVGGTSVNPQELLFARVAPRGSRRRKVASGVKRQCEAPDRSGSSQSGFGDHLSLLDLPVPSEARLKALFDLTTAEARLAQRLARGDSVEEVAQELSIKMTTARTQLAAIFAKTDTRRQAKLVAILSRVAHLG